MALISNPSEPDQSKKRVLIVDAMPQVRHDLRQLLELTGLFIIVAEAGNGLEALQQYMAFSPDVVVLDLDLPVIDGFEVTRQIKVHHPSTHVVILSVYAGGEEIERSRAAGVDGFVMKGDRYEVLVAALLGKDIFPDINNSKKGE